MKSLYSILFLLIVTQWCVADVIEYESDYQGIKVGKSTIRKVIGKFGAPLEKKSYSNNVKYIFRNIHVTIQDST